MSGPSLVRKAIACAAFSKRDYIVWRRGIVRMRPRDSQLAVSHSISSQHSAANMKYRPGSIILATFARHHSAAAGAWFANKFTATLDSTI
jgi:hypothetical protein